MRKEEYIAEAVSKITNRKAKRETEKELAAHIDELIEFYLDRSGSKEEAEERAVADMGGPEKISEDMAKLHKGISKGLAAIIVTAVFATRLVFGIFTSSICLTNFDRFLDTNHWSTVIIRDYLVVLALILLTIISYCHKGKLLKLLIICESAIIAGNILNILLCVIEEPSSVFFDLSSFTANITAAASTFILAYFTYFLCKDDGKEVPKQLKMALGIFSLILCLLYATVFYFIYGTGFTSQLLYSRKMPQEIADIECGSYIDNYNDYVLLNYPYDWDDERGVSTKTGTWCTVDGYFKPTKRFPKEYFDHPFVWILNDNPDYAYFAESTMTNGIRGQIHVRRSILDPYDFMTSELSSVKLRDTDILCIFTQDELRDFREIINTPRDFVPDVDTQKYIPSKISWIDLDGAYSICWYFKGLDGIYLSRGTVARTEDGKIYVCRHYVEDYYERTLSYGIYELTGETRDKMELVLEQVSVQPEKAYSDYILAKEMQKATDNNYSP